MTFMDDYLAGRVDGGDSINAYIDGWDGWKENVASMPLRDHLGMTRAQYEQWFNTGVLPERGAP